MPDQHDRDDLAANHGDADSISNTPETISLAWSGAVRKNVSIPRTIGNVKIGEEIGRGGMGIVHHGWDTVLHRTVAVKFLLAISTDEDNPQFDRFFGGARAEAAVKHPSIVSVHDAGQINGVPYLILEYIDGPSLRAITRPNAPLPLSVAVAVLWDVAEAVQVLHDRDIVHCDLKPGNVLFDREAHLLVTDFGLASLRKRSDPGGTAAGTPAYMAPEMFEGNVSPQSDVYAMGIMLFELLAGRLPFTGDVEAIRGAHYESPLPVDSLPDATPAPLIEMIERATHKSEVFRYKRGELFQRALQDAVDMDELRRDATTRLKDLILGTRKKAPQGTAAGTAKEPSTTTYFDRLGELAEKKRTIQEPPAQAQGSSEKAASFGPTPRDRPTTPATLEVDFPSAQREQQPADLIDLQIPWHANIAPRLFLLFIMVGVCFVGFALARGTGIPMSVRTHPLVYGSVLFLAIYACTKLGRRLVRPRIRSRTQDIVTRFKDKPVRDLVGGLFGNHGRVLWRTYIETMVRVLAEQGRVGVTIRSGPPELATAIDSIAVTFEPRLLDETDVSTIELQDSLDSTTRAAGTTVAKDNLADRLAVRRVKRNIRMAGGWLMFAVFAINVIAEAVESIEKGIVTRFLVIWSLFLIVMIFGVLRPRLSGWRGQWLAVPSGIIIRTAGFRGRKWRLHLFDRRRSVLIVHRLTRNRSYVCVADSESHQVGTASPGDVVFLLRAWLSPVPPPPLESLTDLL